MHPQEEQLLLADSHTENAGTARRFRVGSLCSLLPLSREEDYQFLKDKEEGS